LALAGPVVQSDGEVGAMPIYEYACSCGKTFEVLITRKSDESDVRCPACNGTKVERVISTTVRVHPGLVQGYVPPKKRR
jgi:putative FmdB family regulatory protein